MSLFQLKSSIELTCPSVCHSYYKKITYGCCHPFKFVYLKTNPLEIVKYCLIYKQWFSYLFKNNILFYIRVSDPKFCYIMVNREWIDILLLGCCTRFPCTLIKSCSQLAKITLPSNPLPSPPTGWTNWPINEVHVYYISNV